jgi:AmmeMemoRadiSam system protein B
MIKFSCIAPHPPILIPNIGKENLELISKTNQSLKKLEEEFYQLNPDTIIVISPHGELAQDAFTINQASEFQADFTNFGDLSTKLEFKNDIALGYQLREYLETKAPVRLINDTQLDHGTSVPLFYLTPHLKDVKIIPIGYSLLPLEKHFELGQFLYEKLSQSNKNIGIIASGDLSHRLTPDAPAGYSSRGKEFDDLLIKLLKKKDTQAILKLDKKLIEEAGECGLRSFVILLGILDSLNYKTEILSYEGPFGVGYLVANFKF